jgi:transposase
MNKTSRTDPAQREVFDSGARARTNDPSTSHDAAASVRNMRASHKRILAMFRAYGDMTDETLAEYLNEASKETGLKLMSPSGVRSRRSELSKPNMERLVEIMQEQAMARGFISTLYEAQHTIDEQARRRLRVEGFRSELWDTGKREALASGRQAIVWGLAK